MYIHFAIQFFSKQSSSSLSVTPVCLTLVGQKTSHCLALMHSRSNLFHGKFRLADIFPQRKYCFRPFSSEETPSPTVTELISKQHWKELKSSHLQKGSSSTLLHQLLDSRTDPDLALRYLRNPS